MGKYFLSHTADELDEAVEKVLSGQIYNQRYNEGYTDGYNQGLEEATPTLQSKEAIPSLVEQTITADTGFDGLLSVLIQAIPQSILDAEYQRGYDEASEMLKPYKQELTFLRSTGTQYINTGFVPNQDTRILSTMVCPKVGGANWAYGARVRSGTAQLNFDRDTDNAFQADYGSRSADWSAPSDDQAPFEVDSNKNVITAFGITRTVTAQTFDATVPLVLFGNNTNGTITYGKISFYSCKIWDNDVLVRDYIPVLDWEDVPCLYDKVNRKLYYNAGSGTFTYG